MTTIEKQEIFSALDLGTSKIVCLIAKGVSRADSEGHVDIRVLGMGHRKAKGIKGGKLIDFEAVENVILNTVQAAEQSSGETIKRVYVSIPANLVSSHFIETEIVLSHNLVDDYHLKRLLGVNRMATFGPDRYVVHVLPLSYTVDGVDGIRDPKGMVGQKLSTCIHVVTAPSPYIRNIMNVVGRCHLDIAGFVVSPYASGLATLVDDEMELGVTLIEIGGGYTSVSCFFEGKLLFMGSIPLGGLSVTNDIARCLSTPLAQAERLKTLYGNVVIAPEDERETIFVAPMGDGYQPHVVPRSTLTHVVRARIDEIFDLVRQLLKGISVDPIVFQRVVVTGGTANLQNLKEVAAHALGASQVRIGGPLSVVSGGDLVSNPMFSTVVGSVSYGIRDHAGNQSGRALQDSGSFWGRFNQWLKQNF